MNANFSLQDRLSSLLKTAENLKVKGLAEVSDEEKNSDNVSSAPTSHSRLNPGPPPMTMMGRSTGVSSGVSGQENNNSNGGFVMVNGELKKKRGRPRTLDGPEDDDTGVFSPRISMIQGNVNGVHRTQSPILSSSLSTKQGMSPLQAALSKPLSSYDQHSSSHSKDNSNSSPPVSGPCSPAPTIKLEQSDTGRDTPGSSSLNGTFVSTLSPELVASWGIIKMNDYLVSGTRQQYWEEYFVKNVMGVSVCWPVKQSIYGWNRNEDIKSLFLCFMTFVSTLN